MNSLRTLLLLAAAGASSVAHADLVAHFDMTLHGDNIIESVSGTSYAVEGNFAPEDLPGAVGRALRFDGYTSRVEAALGDIIPAGTGSLTVSLWVAVPCYPIIQLDTDTSEKTAIATCLDEQSKTGFGFYLGFDGKYSFRTYVAGWPVIVDINTPLPTYTWNNLVAVVDGAARTVKVYNNGTEVGSARANGSLSFAPGKFYIGRSNVSRMMGPFELMSFNGLIDDISVWTEAMPLATIQSWKAENEPDLNIPASRFADDIQRPRFHGMPAAGWTNECSGMVYSDGRYHLFFQKNADGPYMARLHWGHISSENLYDWREEKIALAPGAPYDIKGCWSGCVFTDEVVTGGKPAIIYTAVDYAKATVAYASPVDETLADWTKKPGNPIINGRPSGLSDDFRDPYFFRSGDDAYIIVGSSKNGVGTTTLHRYNPAAGTWTNNGDLFFTGTSTAADGRFWEMPTITEMSDGKWLFTATPLETLQGVRTLYWTGSINADGHFVPDANSGSPRLVEMNSREGFGLLSPTIYHHDGKTIVLGIVPDKLPATTNWKLGWAHCYSLPREWSLGADGSLVQKPFEGLKGMRTADVFSRSDFDLDGTVALDPVEGREAEICATFEVGNTDFGFNIFKNASAEGRIYYSPSTGELIADFSRLNRLINDQGVYDGIYRCPLPVRPAAGSELKINIFIDHSIIDIFVNDCWATSIRVFPTESDATGIEAFCDSTVKVRDMKAWILSPAGDSGYVKDFFNDIDDDTPVDVYDISGIKVRSQVPACSATDDLPRGFYIAGNRKIIVR